LIQSLASPESPEQICFPPQFGCTPNGKSHAERSSTENKQVPQFSRLKILRIFEFRYEFSRKPDSCSQFCSNPARCIPAKHANIQGNFSFGDSTRATFFQKLESNTIASSEIFLEAVNLRKSYRRGGGVSRESEDAREQVLHRPKNSYTRELSAVPELPRA
jgi:hypothetical protein